MRAHVNRLSVVTKYSLAIISFWLPTFAHSIEVAGFINASTVTVSGSVDFSSMTISSVTIINSLNMTNTNLPVAGSVLQMQFSSTTAATFANSSTFQAIPDLKCSFALSSATNYIRISLSGILATALANSATAYITIKRDSIDLGNSSDNSGLANASGQGIELYVPVGISLLDRPGDTSSHLYQVYIRSENSVNAVFTNNTVGYLLLEEITR